MSDQKPTKIDYELMESAFGVVALKLMTAKDSPQESQTYSIQLARHFFERIKEVLLFLETERGVATHRVGLPAPFFLPKIYDRQRLAFQRREQAYDGKYYVLDVLAEGEELGTEARAAEFDDIWQAMRCVEDMYMYIESQDVRTGSTIATLDIE